MDADLERARRAEPSWGELRERRVLARVLAERVERARRARRARVAIGGGAVLAAAAAALVLAWVSRTSEPAIAAQGDVPLLARVEASPGRLSLQDGSEVELGADARVEIASQSPTEVRIVQRGGEAQYVVSHRPERPFVVRVGDVEVRVRGTRFVVRVSDPWAEVEVEEGRVEVVRADEVRSLTAGEVLRVRSRIEAAEVGAAAEDEARDHEASVQVEPEAGEVGGEAQEAGAEPATHEAARPGAVSQPAIEPRAAPIDVLLAEADAARRAGRLDAAARALRAAIRAHGDDPRVATALFTLGRVERSRGHEDDAAQAFESAYARAPRGALAEDALAEAAVSWSAAGRVERGRAAAARYLALHPTGLYVGRVRQLME